MNQPVYLRRLLRQKILLIVGVVVAIAAGLLAGFTIQNGEVVPRADRTYMASATILLTSPSPDYFQVRIPGVAQALPQATDEAAAQQELIVSEPQGVDLASNAIILAYLASSDLITDEVAAAVGGLGDNESIIAVSRTTQPSGDETFPGRLQLPLIQVGATAMSPARSERLATEATAAFEALVQQQQQENGIPEDIRLQLDVLNAPVAGEGQGSNPAIPVVVVAFGVFLLFIAAALIVEGIRERGRRRSRDDGDADDSDVDDSELEQVDFDENVEPVNAVAPASRRHGRVRRGAADPDGATDTGAVSRRG